MTGQSHFKQLQIWQEGKQIAIETYSLCKSMPSDERYGLVSQMQRSSVSISSNIAEGYRRNSKQDFRRFLNIALGSAAELETQLEIANEVYNIDAKSLLKKVEIIQRKIHAYLNKLD